MQSGEPYEESRDHADMQFKPGSNTIGEQNGNVAHEHADAGTDGEVGGRSLDMILRGRAQGRVESNRSRWRDGVCTMDGFSQRYGSAYPMNPKT